MNKVKMLLSIMLFAVATLLAVPANAVTSSDIDMQVNVKDIVAPPNVSNFTATPGDRHITLTWTNPADSDFLGVRILRSSNYYPTSPTESTPIYEGSGTSYVDAGLVNGTRYYYSAFSYDSAGNLSSGALSTATPTEPSVVKSIESEDFILPNSQQTATTAQKTEMAITDFKFYLMLEDGPLEVGLNQLNQLVTVKGATLAITIDASIFAKDVNVITITLGGSSYLLRKNEDKNRYEAAFVLPPTKGEYEAAIVIVYKDGNVQTILNKMEVDPYGYVYETAFDIFGLGFGGESRVKNATVTLYQQVNNEWKKWEADKFNQKNPVITDQTGEYAFLVSDGTYYLEVAKNGYKIVKTKPFTVQGQIVNQNVKTFSYIKSIIFSLVIAFLIGIVLYLIIRRKRSRPRTS